VTTVALTSMRRSAIGSPPRRSTSRRSNELALGYSWCPPGGFATITAVAAAAGTRCGGAATSVKCWMMPVPVMSTVSSPPEVEVNTPAAEPSRTPPAASSKVRS
jgi:hypothetical protein